MNRRKNRFWLGWTPLATGILLLLTIWFAVSLCSLLDASASMTLNEQLEAFWGARVLLGGVLFSAWLFVWRIRVMPVADGLLRRLKHQPEPRRKVKIGADGEFVEAYGVPVDYELSGQGSQITQPIFLIEGLYRLEHHFIGFVQLWLVRANDGARQAVGAESITGHGSLSFFVPADGFYLFEVRQRVKLMASWTFDIGQI